MSWVMDQVKFVDERIAAAKQRYITAGTATTSTDKATKTVFVVFHGSTQSVPVKAAGNLYVQANERVVLMKVEADWVVVATFSRGLPTCQVADPATRDALFDPTTTPSGQSVYTVSTGELEMWTGTAWVGCGPRVKRLSTAINLDDVFTPTVVSELSFSVEAAPYVMQGEVFYQCSLGTGDGYFDFSAPANDSESMWTALGARGAPATDDVTQQYQGAKFWNEAVGFDGIAVLDMSFQMSGTLNATAAGTLSFRTCTLTNNTGSDRIRIEKGTWISLTKVA